MRRHLDRKKFGTEAELCAEFMEWAQPQGWTSYPETADFDILLVAEDGTQIGIQAKLRFNVCVIEQILPTGNAWAETSGPDYRAVLVPSGGSRDICSALGLTLIQHDGVAFYPKIADARAYSEWHYLSPSKRCPLPAYVPDVIAGSAAPIQLTDWKLRALRAVAILSIRGYLTRQDFRACGIDHRRWVQTWLRPGVEPGQFIASHQLPDFPAQHPVVFPKVLEEERSRLGATI